MLLWLWCRPAAVALILPVAWELPYATDTALKSKKSKTDKQNTTPFAQEFSCGAAVKDLALSLQQLGIAAMEQVRSLAQELLHAIGMAKKKFFLN